MNRLIDSTPANITPSAVEREFTGITNALEANIGIFSADPKNKSARALIVSPTGKSHVIDFTYDPEEKRLKSILRVSAQRALPPAQTQTLLRLQNLTDGSWSVAFDDEDVLFKLRASAVIPNVRVAPVIIASVVKDLTAVLKNEMFINLTN